MPANRLMLSLVLLVTAGMVQAQNTTASPSEAASSTTATTVSRDRLASEFSSFAGSQDNARALVDGLRTGSTVTLTETAPGGAATVSTFEVPTKPMGYGNVRIALSLARAQLASQGITQPTAQQLQAALVGVPATADGSATSGILQMRAEGMGWGQIANRLGFKLGAVMSGRVPVTANPGSTIVTAGVSTTSSKGITTAAGASAAASGPAGQGKGVVTAAGAPGLAIGHANKGAVASGVVSAHGQGGGLALGAGKNK